MSDPKNDLAAEEDIALADPIPLSPAQELIVRRLLTRIEETKEELRLDRQAREYDKKIADRNSRLTWIIVGLLAVLLAGAIGFTLNFVSSQNAEDRDAREQELATCSRGNDTRVLINQLNNGTQDLAEGVLALSNSLRGIIQLVNVPNPDRSPDSQARLDQFIAQSISLIDAANAEISESIRSINNALLDLRDCSPEALFGPTATVVSSG